MQKVGMIVYQYIYIQCICWEGEKINEQIAILSNYKENSKA